MISIPALVFFLAVIAVYLSGCLVYHIRDIHDERKDQNGSSRRSMPGTAARMRSSSEGPAATCRPVTPAAPRGGGGLSPADRTAGARSA